MRLILTAILLATGLFYLIGGLGFVITPHAIGPEFGLSANGAQGWSTIRADMTAFFLVVGACLAWGAWRRAGDMLLVPAALCGIAFTGRVISLFVDGGYDGAWSPMLGEAFTVIAAIAGNRLLPHHKVEEIAG
ncbi:MAG: DUF4345 family protein [Candidatus Andeanibacterium colombiense]|uniref:DUF4345 family protein n=1 Tax=Candidatus Andeanibacterium colombiense TaxID=3121345 RepID=A0AAJ6BR07_9SPHN|nr:MAG: DUF4345 family protein [Sphingomonadaceae bacterium]